MRFGMLMAGFSVISLTAILPVSSPQAQQSAGRLYAFHPGRVGGCPVMDWHVVLTPDHALNGFIAWDGMKHVAKVSGSVATGKIFLATAVEEGGTKLTATIKGQVEDSFIVAPIDGTKTACHNQQISVPYFVAGMSGGGG